jgi:hypothetical protein
MTDPLEQLEHYQELVAQYEGEIKKLLRPAFEAAARKLFEENPDIKSFSWRQYTPYFNDGDTCYFGRGEERINGMSDEYDDPPEGKVPYFEDSEEWPVKDEYGQEITHAVWKRWTAAIGGVMRKFRSEDCEQMFGDHTEVTVTPDGITTDEHTSHN